MDNEMTLGQWIGTIVLTCIPCVNIVMLFIWALGNGQYVARKRWAQASLIVWAVCFVLAIIFYAVAGAALFAGLAGASTYGY